MNGSDDIETVSNVELQHTAILVARVCAYDAIPIGFGPGMLSIHEGARDALSFSSRVNAAKPAVKPSWTILVTDLEANDLIAFGA